MEGFSDKLALATRNIPRQYIYLNIMGGGSVTQERVYCYELYHQLRCQWLGVEPFILTAELSKRAHEEFHRRGLQVGMPDFLVHVQESMDDNFAVLEVKPAHNANERTFREDVEALLTCVNGAEYKRGVFLVFNVGDWAVEEFVRMFEHTYQEAARAGQRLRHQYRSLELWIHGEPETPAYAACVITRDTPVNG